MDNSLEYAKYFSTNTTRNFQSNKPLKKVTYAFRTLSAKLQREKRHTFPILHSVELNFPHILASQSQSLEENFHGIQAILSELFHGDKKEA